MDKGSFAEVVGRRCIQFKALWYFLWLRFTRWIGTREFSAFGIWWFSLQKGKGYVGWHELCQTCSELVARSKGFLGSLMRTEDKGKFGLWWIGGILFYFKSNASFFLFQSNDQVPFGVKKYMGFVTFSGSGGVWRGWIDHRCAYKLSCGAFSPAVLLCGLPCAGPPAGGSVSKDLDVIHPCVKS